MKGFAAGALALIALQIFLSTPLASLSTAAALPARWAQAWMSPYAPLIPARAGTTTTPAAPAATGTAPAPVNPALPPPAQAGTRLTL